ncbi:MAG: Outer rane lipoprotein, partial [Abditibacteriota bacterium]|nr:Outer rane lipoprotein [Abditibacteriota bacterium]
MRHLIIAIIAVAVLTLVGPLQAQENDRQQADKAWNEKSYVRALELYRKVLSSSAQLREREEIEFRVAVALGKTEKWDEAIVEGEALSKKTQWKARVLYWMGRLYTQVPDQAYRVDKKLYYGSDYPKIAGAEKPQQEYIGEENAQATLKYFEDAKIAAQRERDIARRGRFAGPIYPLASDEEIDLNFDLAAFLPQRELHEFIAALDAKKQLDEMVDVTRPYDRAWHLPKKVLYLYNEIARLDQSKDKHDSALALLAKGMWVRGYRGRMDQWANQFDDNQKKYVKRPYPFDHLQAIPIWQELVENFPRDPIAPQMQLLIAQSWAEQNDLVKARKAYEELVQKFPKSKWVSDARMAIQQITKREIAIYTMGAQQPGRKAKINIVTRNLNEL